MHPTITEIETLGTDSTLSERLGSDPIGQDALAKKTAAFKMLEQEEIVRYLEAARKHKQQNSSLLVLSGFSETLQEGYKSGAIAKIMLADKAAHSGLFIRWKGKGIAINPGKGFLERLHKSGYFATDIDACIVTKCDPASWKEILPLYNFLFKLNRINPEHKTIHYYLNQTAHQALSHHLKPHFKQEKGCVRPLELFIDSPDVETIELFPEITLRYFALEREISSALGIQLELSGGPLVSYTGGSSWNPFIASHLKGTELLVAEFGRTHPNDWEKLHYTEGCLGYFGIASILEELSPPLAFLSEFDGSDGDLRTEVVQKLKREGITTKVIAAETGFEMDLDTFGVTCPITSDAVNIYDAEFIPTQKEFGPFQILSPSSRF